MNVYFTRSFVFFYIFVSRDSNKEENTWFFPAYIFMLICVHYFHFIFFPCSFIYIFLRKCLPTPNMAMTTMLTSDSKSKNICSLKMTNLTHTHWTSNYFLFPLRVLLLSLNLYICAIIQKEKHILSSLVIYIMWHLFFFIRVF